MTKTVGIHFGQTVTLPNQLPHSNVSVYMLEQHPSNSFVKIWLSKKVGKCTKTMKGQTIAFFDNFHFGNHTTLKSLKKKKIKNTQNIVQK